VRLEPSL